MNTNYINTGLTNSQVNEAKEKYGSNKITSRKKEGFFKLFIESLGDPIIRILLIALGIKMVFLIKDFDWYETVGIVIAIFIASFISTISEYGSEKAFEKLQEESSKIKCRVKRDNKIMEIKIDDVVKGDIVLLESGDRIPADGILVTGSITTDESSLNGETKENYKEAIKNITMTPDEHNIVYRGTVVYSNEGTMMVTNIGDDTLYGRLAREIQEKQPDSPLKIRLRKLAEIISKMGYIGAILVSISYLFSTFVLKNNFNLGLIYNDITNIPLLIGHILYALTLSVTIIVVAVPEGLPMMITLVLSSNMKKMLKNNVLVRKLMGIETAGSINILYTDKTGTLTKGKLETIGFMSGNLKEYPNEYVLSNHPKLHEMVKTSIIYNSSSSYNSNNEIIGGNITDKAILSFIKNDSNLKYKKINTIPFNSKNKYSITEIDNGNYLKLIKGAPEKILPYCNSYYDEFGNTKTLLSKKNIQEKIDNMTSNGIRVIMLAISNSQSKLSFNNLTLVGLLFMKDDIRPEAKEGIKLVKEAHIQTVMITGDNKNTAMSIGREVGLLTNNNDIVLTSDELNKLNDDELKKLLPNIRIIARSLPQDKSRLVKISQELNLVVGMTGDGVNDAPALKRADVGFAMGSGTEVAKEASDIVILDDNFISISKAILFGRTIFKSIRKFIIFQLTVNLCAVSLSIIGPFIRVETPVTVIQMLWINMVMDTLAGLAFSFEPPLLEYMKEYPKKKDEDIINSYMLGEILFTGIYSSILCILFLKLPIFKDIFRYDSNNIYLMTAFFGLFIFVSIFNSFNARTNRINILANIMKNKVFLFIILFITIIQVLLIYYGGNIFRTAGLTLFEFQVMFITAFTVIPIDWIRKIYLRRKGTVGGV